MTLRTSLSLRRGGVSSLVARCGWLDVRWLYVVYGVLRVPQTTVSQNMIVSVKEITFSCRPFIRRIRYSRSFTRIMHMRIPVLRYRHHERP